MREVSVREIEREWKKGKREEKEWEKCVQGMREVCVCICVGERERRKKRKKGDDNFYMVGIIEEKRESKKIEQGRGEGL